MLQFSFHNKGAYAFLEHHFCYMIYANKCLCKISFRLRFFWLKLSKTIGSGNQMNAETESEKGKTLRNFPIKKMAIGFGSYYMNIHLNKRVDVNMCLNFNSILNFNNIF